MSEIGDTYAEGRKRTTALVQDAGPGAGDAVIPTCPAWTVKDLLGHLAGVCSDILAGRLDGVGSDEWTDRQVCERRTWPIEKVLEEWEENAPRCESIAEHFPGSAARQWVMDATTHEHDIRCALGAPGDRDSRGVRTGFGWMTERLDEYLRGESLPGLRIVTPEGDDVVVGAGDPKATVTAPRFELFRAFTGRRSASQISSFDWDGDPAEHLHVFQRPPFSLAQRDISE